MVVWVGETDFEVRLDTSPTPLSMLMAPAPVTDHDNVVAPPELMLDGLAEKEEIVGPEPELELIVASAYPPKSVVQYQP